MMDPTSYLEMALARQTELIIFGDYTRLLRSTKSRRNRRTRSLRTYVATGLYWLADQLQVEPNLATAAGSS